MDGYLPDDVNAYREARAEGPVIAEAWLCTRTDEELETLGRNLRAAAVRLGLPLDGWVVQLADQLLPPEWLPGEWTDGPDDDREVGF